MRKIILLILITSQGFAQTKFNSKLWAKIPEGKVFLGNTTLRSHCKLGGERANDPVCKDLKEVSGFYISKYEVSISDYLLFLQEISSKEKEMYTPIFEKIEYSSDPESYSWTFDYKEIFNSNNGHFPVVGITYEAASSYCKWLEIRIKKILKKDIEVRLPAEIEWIRASVGDNYFNIYSWNSFLLSDNKCNYQCNFMPFDETRSKYNHKEGVFSKTYFRHESDGHFAIAPVKTTYRPNSYGLYNVLGNVSEMILEK